MYTEGNGAPNVYRRQWSSMYTEGTWAMIYVTRMQWSSIYADWNGRYIGIQKAMWDICDTKGNADISTQKEMGLYVYRRHSDCWYEMILPLIQFPYNS